MSESYRTARKLRKGPLLYLDKVPGIDLGIEGWDMPYVSWFLLNEAFWCSRNYAYFAAIACLIGSVEVCLRRLAGLDEKARLQEVIKAAQEKGVITSLEATDLQELRRARNSFVHFKLEKLPKALAVRRIKPSDLISTQVAGEEEVELYPSEAYKDLVPFMTACPICNRYANKVVAMYKRIFPRRSSNGQPPYFRVVNVDLLGIPSRRETLLIRALRFVGNFASKIIGRH